MNPLEITKHCPKCGSIRVHHSRRRGVVDRLLGRLGAEICRCHDCRSRQAWFGILPISIGKAEASPGSLAGSVVLGSGFLICLIFIWWMIARFTAMSG